MANKELENIVETEKQHSPKEAIGQKYGLFSEQYLEKPVISGDYKMNITPTACTIKGIPVIDDY